jgi:hypothetical protein
MVVTRRAAAASRRIDALSDDLLSVSFEMLPCARDLAACEQVCATWRNIASRDALWKARLAHEHGDWPAQPARITFAALRVAGRAATLLGAWDYIGFYEERLSSGLYTLAFWLRAWPAMISVSGVMSPGLQGMINYVFLNPPPHAREDFPLGCLGGERFIGHWDWRTRKLHAKCDELVAGSSLSQPVEDLLVLTPHLDLDLSSTGVELTSATSFVTGEMERRGVHANVAIGSQPPCVRMRGVPRLDAEPAQLLRALRPDADLSGLPPGDSWRPARWAGGGFVGFPGFDVWPHAEHESSRLQAAMRRHEAPLGIGA